VNLGTSKCSCKIGLELKPLDVDLLPAAVALDKLCLGGLWTLEGYQRELESPNSDLIGLLQTEVPASASSSYRSLLGIGCLWAILEEAHITILAVHPDYQRQGLGQALLYSLLIAARKRGLEWATLEVRPSNQPALALYQAIGFQKVGRRRRYYHDTGEDALILWRRGLQLPEFQNQLKLWRSRIQDQLQRAEWCLALPES
jgi:ribosomal-protein-alanine N-acetyltransferase